MDPVNHTAQNLNINDYICPIDQEPLSTAVKLNCAREHRINEAAAGLLFAHPDFYYGVRCPICRESVSRFTVDQPTRDIVRKIENNQQVTELQASTLKQNNAPEQVAATTGLSVKIEPIQSARPQQSQPRPLPPIPQNQSRQRPHQPRPLPPVPQNQPMQSSQQPMFPQTQFLAHPRLPARIISSLQPTGEELMQTLTRNIATLPRDERLPGRLASLLPTREQQMQDLEQMMRDLQARHESGQDIDQLGQTLRQLYNNLEQQVRR